MIRKGAVLGDNTSIVFVPSIPDSELVKMFFNESVLSHCLEIASNLYSQSVPVSDGASTSSS